MKVDMVVMRHGSPGASHFLSRNIKANIVNAGDGTHEHPTQALLDAYSMQEKLGDLTGKKNRHHRRYPALTGCTFQYFFCLQKLGAEVMVCGPITLLPKYISSLGVKVELDVKKALEWCDVANVLRIQLERQQIKYFPSLREYSLYYGSTKRCFGP